MIPEFSFATKVTFIPICNDFHLPAIGGSTICTEEPSDVLNAVKTGSGSFDGATRTFTCNENYEWDDGSTGGKDASCSASGSWTSISFTCNRMSYWPDWIGKFSVPKLIKQT